MLYDLTRLGSLQFESLVQRLLSGTFGVAPPSFARGRYAERESGYADRLAWPSDSRRGVWEGHTLIELQFLAQPVGRNDQHDNDYAWLSRRVDETGKRWRRDLELRKTTVKARATSEYYRKASEIEPPLPEHLLLITNVEFTSAKRRDFDAILRAFARAIGLTDFAIWDYDDLSRFLDNQPEVRQEFFSLISTQDPLSQLHIFLADVSPEFSGTISRYTAMELMADQWVRLTQAGDPMHGKLPLSELAIDLPLQSPTAEPYAAQYIVREGNRRMRRSSKEDDTFHIVILGGPGQGKTTIGQLACQAYRAALLTDAAWLEGGVASSLESIREGLARIGLPGPVNRRWPIRIELSAYADIAGSPKRMSLLRYIADQIASRTSDETTVANMRTWLRAYPWLLVLDGLDEVASALARDTLMERVSEFLIEAAKADADLFVVITTRPQGYAGEFRSDQYTHLTLDSLTSLQAAAYSRQLAEIRHADDPDMCRKLIRRMEFASAEESTARLMRSPLQVTIMSMLLEARERAPQARYALFEAYYETIYAREAAKPGTAGRLLQEQRSHVNILHDRVGLILQIESEKAGVADASIPQRRLRELAVERLVAEGYLPSDAALLGDEIVTAVTSRLVLLVPKALEDVAFEVRSIQEFFAARAIVSGSDQSVIDRLRIAVPAVHWRNTWLFAAGRVFAQREHLRLNLIALLAEVDTSDMLNLVVAPGVDLALDLLDDDLTVTAPRLQRMLGSHALTLLDYPPDQDLERRTLILYRNAARDRVIRAAAEKALDQSLRSTPAQAKSARIVCRFWRNQDGYLAEVSRQLITRRSTTTSTIQTPDRRRPDKATIATLLRDQIRDAELTTQERALSKKLLSSLGKVRLLPDDVELDAASVLASDRSVSLDLKDACFSSGPIVDAIAAATIDAANDTWVGASELRNMLRVWLQRRPVGSQILAATPFLDVATD